jgi:hypothetical protein
VLLAWIPEKLVEFKTKILQEVISTKAEIRDVSLLHIEIEKMVWNGAVRLRLDDKLTVCRGRRAWEGSAKLDSTA